MSTKFCNRCQRPLPVSAFNKNKRKKDGLQSCCRECSKFNDKRYYENNKDKRQSYNKKRLEELRRFLENLKLSKKCLFCHFASYVTALEFHHLYDKDINISNAVRRGWSKQRILKEVDKCILVCVNCHRKIHHTNLHDSKISAIIKKNS
jgi:hypothetical protein